VTIFSYRPPDCNISSALPSLSDVTALISHLNHMLTGRFLENSRCKCVIAFNL
jgi:hypothetical protein